MDLTLKFLLTGNWSKSQVSITWMANSRRIIPEVETAIDIAWEKALARPGVNLFDGPMCRLESWLARDDRLILRLSESSYKTFLGTNMANPQFAHEFGPQVMANPVGVSPALVTADHQLLLGRRNASVAYHPNRVHPFAGCMEPRDADPFASIHRELEEELSLAANEITDIRCLGLVQDQNLHQPELIFAVKTNLNKSDIECRLDPTEHQSIWSIAAVAEAVEKSVVQDRELTPIAVAALLLWSRGETMNDER